MTKDSKETKLQEKSKRPKRKRLQQAGPLFVDTDNLDKGFHYRIVNDTPKEINKRKRMGYEIVQSTDITIGDSLAGDSKLGSVPSTIVDSNGMAGILMRIPNDEHQEILDELEELNQEVDDSVKERVTAGDKNVYGSITKE